MKNKLFQTTSPKCSLSLDSLMPVIITAISFPWFWTTPRQIKETQQPMDESTGQESFKNNKAKKANRLCISPAGASILYFKINTNFFNKVVNKQWRSPNQYFRINFNNIILHSFCWFFCQTWPVYPTMVGENFQIDYVRTTEKCICGPTNWR